MGFREAIAGWRQGLNGKPLDQQVTEKVNAELTQRSSELGGLAPSAISPRSMLFDPLSLIGQTQYKERYSSLTYDVLAAMSEKTEQVNAIINTRIAQICSFAQPARWKKNSLGFQIRFKDANRKPTKEERGRLDLLEDIFYQTGYTDRYRSGERRPNFAEFLKRFVRDSLIYDQACHPANTRIEMFGAFINIQDVKVGHQVFSHNGELAKVEQIYSRKYSGNLYSIKSRGQKITATEGHPLLVLKDKWAYLGTRRKPFVSEWLEAKNISSGMYLTYPRIKLPESDVEAVFGDKTHHIDSEFGRFLGLYVAEGNQQNGSVRLTFHSDETELADFTLKFAEKIGLKSHVDPVEGRNAITVFINSNGSGFGDWLEDLCGKGSENKMVPLSILLSSRKVRRAFIGGYLSGDGTIYKTKAKINTTSRQLFVGLRHLLSAEGIYLAESELKVNRYGVPCLDQYRGNISGKEYRELARENGLEVAEPTKERSAYLVDDEYFYIRVNEVKCSQVEDLDVYNFEVEKTHSYLANGCISHNCFEIVPAKNGKPCEFWAVDASTIRVAQPRMQSVEGLDDGRDLIKYVQIYNNVVRHTYTYRELAFCIRNVRNSIKLNGYGYSELEMLINMVTSILFAQEYNRRFFSNGSMINGLLNIKGANVPQEMLESFRRQWHALASNVTNAHKIPVLTSKDGIEFINLHSNNRDMEYNSWIEYLVKMVTAVYLIDPAEINFDYRGASESAPLFETSPEAKLKHSRDKGLRNLLNFIEEQMNYHILHQIDRNLYFEFTGIDMKDEQEMVNIRASEVQAYKTLDETREEAGLEPYDDEEIGNLILNPVVVNYKLQQQAQQQQAQQMEAQAGQGGEQGQPDPNNPGDPNEFVQGGASSHPSLQVGKAPEGQPPARQGKAK